MPNRKGEATTRTVVADAASTAVAARQQRDALSALRASRRPPAMHFPLLVALSLGMAALLHKVAAEYIAGPVARVSRSADGWEEVAVMVAWRTFELGLCWYGSYDSHDLAALSLLSHGPFLFLLYSFYGVPAPTAVLSLAIHTLSTAAPFLLLRPLSAAHGSAHRVHNRDILTDPAIQTLTTLLAAGIYSVVLHAAYASYLPVALATHFAAIPSVAAAHTSTHITLLPLALLAGLAARSFIFTPVAAMPADDPAVFDPAAASFADTLRYNFWGWGARGKTLIRRAAALVLLSGGNTFGLVYGTVEGVDACGAAAYAVVWVVAAAVTGLALGVVGAV